MTPTIWKSDFLVPVLHKLNQSLWFEISIDSAYSKDISALSLYTWDFKKIVSTWG